MVSCEGISPVITFIVILEILIFRFIVTIIRTLLFDIREESFMGLIESLIAIFAIYHFNLIPMCEDLI